MTKIQLTPAQRAILAYAIQHTGGKIEWFPDNIKGGARAKVLAGLAKRALIAAAGADWLVASGGYGALGLEAPQKDAQKAPRTREISKQAQVIAMLRHPKGQRSLKSARPPAGKPTPCAARSLAPSRSGSA